MMPSSRLFTLSLSLALLCCFSCNKSKDTSIVGTYALIQSTTANGAADDFEQSVIDADIKQVAENITLFEDKTYTIINEGPTYSQGTWTYTDKLKTIVLASDFINQKKKVGFLDQVKKPFKLSIINKDLNQKLIYSHSTYADSVFKNHPYYPANNAWRIKPLQKESDAAIKDRLALYLKHMALILKSSLDNESQVISFQYSQGPVRIYNGGIGVIPFEKVNENWKAVFFDEADAIKAFELYKTAVKESSLTTAGTGEWVADDYRILLAVYGSLKKNTDNPIPK